MKPGLMIILTTAILVACTDFGPAVQGSGKLATETRSLETFDQIVITTSADVQITAGETVTCEISGDDNIIPLITTNIAAGELRISATDNFRSRNPVKVTLQVPLITKVSIKGSGDVDLRDVTTDSAEFTVSGSGDITANGTVGKLVTRTYGSGDMLLAGLKAGQADVSIKGSGNARLWVSGKSLAISIAGSGNVSAKGDVESLTVGVYGSGESQLADLQAKAVEVKIAGSGNAEVWATDSLKAETRGSGNIRYKGEPTEFQKTATGSGDVVKW